MNCEKDLNKQSVQFGEIISRGSSLEAGIAQFDSICDKHALYSLLLPGANNISCANRNRKEYVLWFCCETPTENLEYQNFMNMFLYLKAVKVQTGYKRRKQLRNCSQGGRS